MVEDRVDRRLAAIWAGDIAGYSRLMGADEEGTLRQLKAHRKELVDPKITEHRGRIVKTTGDGMLVEFVSVVDAVRCAVEIQRGMAERNAEVSDEKRIEFRIGINVGDIISDANDIYGDGVNVAARLEGLAKPGGILVSRNVYDQVRDKLSFSFEDLGEQTVKNIARPIGIHRIELAEHATPAAAGAASQDRHGGFAKSEKPSIAVLPFANMSGDQEQEYFADGISEDIITALSKLRWFFVIARNSSFTYKGKAVDVKRVALELGVRYVLEGSVRKSGNRMRITSQLIDAATGNHLWAERFDRDVADIFAVQDEITERVVSAIEPQLYAAENIRSQRKPPESLDAWECVTRALTHIASSNAADYEIAEALCRRAIALAPRYAQAHSVLAFALMRRAVLAGGTADIAPVAFGHAQTAINLDEQDPWAHFALGYTHFMPRRFAEAVTAFRKAIALNPNFAAAHAMLGNALACQGETDEALKCVERAVQLSPGDLFLSVVTAICMTYVHFVAGRYADSVAWARKTIERQPEFVVGYRMLVAAAAMSGQAAVAAQALATLRRLQPGISLAWARENMNLSDEPRARFVEGLRRAGVGE